MQITQVEYFKFFFLNISEPNHFQNIAHIIKFHQGNIWCIKKQILMIKMGSKGGLGAFPDMFCKLLESK